MRRTRFRTPLRLTRAYLVTAMVSVAACHSATQPNVPPPELLPADLTWSTREQLAVWVNNELSSGDLQLVSEQQESFIRIRIGPPRPFVLRGPNLPNDAAPITAVRLVYRWAPAEPRHLLNVFYAFVVPRDPVDDSDRALLGFVLDAPTWSNPGSSPIAGRLPFAVRYVSFTASVTNDPQSSVTPGTLDIRSIQLTR